MATGPAPGMDDAAKNAAKLREELQEILFASRDVAQEASLIAKALGMGSIESSNFRKSFKDTADIAKKLADNTDEILSGLKNSNDVQKDILKNDASRKSLQTETSQILGKIASQTKGLTQTQRDEIKNAKTQSEIQNILFKYHRDISEEHKAALNLSQEQLGTNKENAKILKEQLDTSKKIDKASGLTGGALKAINQLTGGHIKGLDEALQTSRKEIAELQRKGKLMDGFSGKMQGLGIQMKNMGKAVLESFTDPLVVITTIAKSLGNLDKLLTNNQKILNQTTSESREYYQEMQNVARASDNINVTYKSLIESQLALTKHLGISSNFSNQMKEDFIVLTKQAKISEESAAGLAKQSIISGQELGKASDNAALTGVNMLRAKGINVSFQKILEQTAKVTGQVAVNLGNNPEKIAAAVAKATELGTTLEGVNKIAMSLLDFESSIEKEMEAELLIGRELNLERARALALTGDQEELAAELLDQVGSYKEFADMNVIQQQKLAAAMGMGADEMSNMLAQQEMQGKSAEELRALGKEDLAQMKEKQDAQEKFQASIEQLKALFVNLMDNLMPLVDLFTSALLPVIETIGWTISTLIIEPIEYIIESVEAMIGVFTGANEELTVMQTIVGSIAAAFALAKTTQLALLGITKIQTAWENRKLLLSKKENALGVFGLLRNAGKFILGMFAAGAKAPFPLNLALPFILGGIATGIAASLVSKYSKGNDVLSPGTGMSGYGSRMLLGPEGAIALNNKDTVIAGTKLFQKGDDVISSPAGSITMPEPQPINVNVETKTTMDLFPSTQNVASVQVSPIVP